MFILLNLEWYRIIKINLNKYTRLEKGYLELRCWPGVTIFVYLSTLFLSNGYSNFISGILIGLFIYLGIRVHTVLTPTASTFSLNRLFSSGVKGSDYPGSLLI